MGRGALEHHVLRQTRGRCAVAWIEERVVRLWAGRYASGHAECPTRNSNTQCFFLEQVRKVL